MTKFFLAVAVFTLCYLSVEVLAIEEIARSEDSPKVPIDEDITMTPSGIHVLVKKRPLQEILQFVHERSSIQFTLSPILQSVMITATIDAPDWPAAVQQLLSQFNTAEVWDQAGRQLRQVFIIEQGSAQNFSTEAANFLGSDNPKIDAKDPLIIPPASLLPPPPPPPPLIIK